MEWILHIYYWCIFPVMTMTRTKLPVPAETVSGLLAFCLNLYESVYWLGGYSTVLSVHVPRESSILNSTVLDVEGR